MATLLLVYIYICVYRSQENDRGVTLLPAQGGSSQHEVDPPNMKCNYHHENYGNTPKLPLRYMVAWQITSEIDVVWPVMTSSVIVTHNCNTGTVCCSRILLEHTTFRKPASRENPLQTSASRNMIPPSKAQVPRLPHCGAYESQLRPGRERLQLVSHEICSSTSAHPFETVST